MFEYLKSCWRGVLTVVGVLAVITALTTFSSNLATSGDIRKVREETKQSIGELRKSMELDRDIARLNQAIDSLIKAKLLLKTYPKDQDLVDTVEQLNQDKKRLQKRIEGR